MLKRVFLAGAILLMLVTTGCTQKEVQVVYVSKQEMFTEFKPNKVLLEKGKDNFKTAIKNGKAKTIVKHIIEDILNDPTVPYENIEEIKEWVRGRSETLIVLSWTNIPEEYDRMVVLFTNEKRNKSYAFIWEDLQIELNSFIVIEDDDMFESSLSLSDIQKKFDEPFEQFSSEDDGITVLKETMKMSEVFNK